MTDIVDHFRPVLDHETLPPFQELYSGEHSSYFAWSQLKEDPNVRLFPDVPAQLLGVIFSFKPEGAPIGYLSRKMVAANQEDIPVIQKAFIAQVGPMQKALDGFRTNDRSKQQIFGTSPFVERAIHNSCAIPARDGFQTIAGFAVMRTVETNEVISAIISPKKTLEEVGLMYREDLLESQKIFEEAGISFTETLDEISRDKDIDIFVGTKLKELIQGHEDLKIFSLAVVTGSLPPVEIVAGGGRVERLYDANPDQNTTPMNRAERRRQERDKKRRR